MWPAVLYACVTNKMKEVRWHLRPDNLSGYPCQPLFNSRLYLNPFTPKQGAIFGTAGGLVCFVCVCAQREVILDSSASIFQFENIYMGLSFKRICFFRWKELVWDWVRQTERGKMDNAGTNAENKGFLLLSGISKVHFHVSMILEWHLRNAKELTLTFNNLNNSLHFQKGLTSRRNTIHFPA